MNNQKPTTELLNRMFSEITYEIEHLNNKVLPYLKARFGVGCMNTNLIIKCAGEPVLINAPGLQSTVIELKYQGCMKYSGRAMAIDKKKFIARYYATEEGQAYKKFLEGLPPEQKEQYNIF